MIKIQNKPYRQTTAKWIWTVGGEEKTEDIRLEYFSLSVKQIRENQAELELRKKDNPEAFIWLSEMLAPRLKSLPDLVDVETDKPIEITLEFLENQDIRNLQSLSNAIKNDESPKSPAVSSPEK